MSSKTKIVVLHMKEIIYTVLFICLGILLVALLTFMFHPKNKETSSSKSTSYQPGIYTSQLTLGDKELEVEVFYVVFLLSVLLQPLFRTFYCTGF